MPSRRCRMWRGACNSASSWARGTTHFSLVRFLRRAGFCAILRRAAPRGRSAPRSGRAPLGLDGRQRTAGVVLEALRHACRHRQRRILRRVAHADSLQLTLGALPGGVRGYRNSRVVGAVRSVARVEERWSLGQVTRHVGLGLATFADAGRLWAGDAPFGVNSGVKAGVGTGLRGGPAAVKATLAPGCRGARKPGCPRALGSPVDDRVGGWFLERAEGCGAGARRRGPLADLHMAVILDCAIKRESSGRVTALLHQYRHALSSERVRRSERPLHPYFGPLSWRPTTLAYDG